MNPETLTAYEAVTSARLWEKHGKRRIYLDTPKRNGGRKWNGGNGFASCYVDLDANTLVARGVAGAATREYLVPLLSDMADELGLAFDWSER